MPIPKNSPSRECATTATKRFLADTQPRAPFQVQRVLMIDFDKREALCDLGAAGSGWVNLDQFGITDPVWRSLDDLELTRLARNFRALRHFGAQG